jgi:hypothetical protein
MKKLSILVLVFVATIISSCEQNLIEAIQPKPSKNIKEAKARLVSSKWTIYEAYENDAIVYQNGVNSSADADIDINYVKFRPDGVFEISYKTDPLDESLRWSIDEKNNILSIFDSQNNDYREDWTIEAGSVYEDYFEMTYAYEYIYYLDGIKKTETNKMKLNMKRIK